LRLSARVGICGSGLQEEVFVDFCQSLDVPGVRVAVCGYVGLEGGYGGEEGGF